MSKALTPLTVIATDVCGDLGDSTLRYQFSIMRKLMAGWRDLNLYVNQDFKVKTAVLAYDNVVTLPCDFVFETKVGIKYNGHIAVLTLDKAIDRETISQQETETQLKNIWCGSLTGNEYTFYNYLGNNGLGELYGYGGNVNINGYYNIDRGSGEIFIGSLVPDGAEIVIEYKSSGEDTVNLIPTECWTCLKYYALSEWFLVKEPSKGQMFRGMYEQAYNKLKRTYNYRTALFMANEAQSHYSSNPK